MPRYDVVTLGETMLRLTPPGLRRLEQTTTLDVEVSGSESNVAIGLARLGLTTAWLSRLTANPLGRLIAQTIAGHGVDTSQVVWTDDDRIGLFFLEEGRAPRGSQVFYDRRHSALSQMRPEDLPSTLFQPDGARLLHLTGITLALGPHSAATCQRALELAQAAGWQVSFDVNYRRTLWDPTTARQHCEAYLQRADLIFIPRRDACTLYDLAPTLPADDVLTVLATRYPQATIALTLGSEGAIGGNAQGQRYHQAAFPAEAVGRIGGGDAFAAGFLYASLTTPPATRLQQALAWGAATAALKYSIPGDAPRIERHEVAALLAQGREAADLRR